MALFCPPFPEWHFSLFWLLIFSLIYFKLYFKGKFLNLMIEQKFSLPTALKQRLKKYVSHIVDPPP